MTNGRRRVVGYLLLLGAIAWPLEVLQYVPGLGVSLLGVVALLLLPVLVLDALAEQKLRVPFEFLAPVTLLLILLGAEFALGHESDRAGQLVTAAILLVAVAHFAPTHDSIRRLILASVLSGAAVTLVTLVARLVDWIPTAYSLRSGVTYTFAYTVPSGVHVLLLVLVAAIYITRERRYSPVERAAASGAIVPLAAALIGPAILWARDTHSLPIVAYPELDAIQIASAAVALWLVARIAGKMVVAMRRSRDLLHILWLSAALVSFIPCVCATVPPGAYQGFLAGLACATASAGRLEFRPPRAAFALAVAPLALAAANLFMVFPGNTYDQRNYDRGSRRDFDAGRLDRLLARLDAIERHAPRERRSHLWRARAALALEDPNWASFEFARSVEPATGRLLFAPPSRAERKDFLVQMRDTVATMRDAESVCAFERALFAEGERDSALYSMRLEATVLLSHVDTENASPFAGAVAHVVGDPSLAADLEVWSPNELITLLMQWGGTVVTGEPAPLVVVAQRTLEGLDIYVHNGERSSRFLHVIDPPHAGDFTRLQSSRALRWWRLSDSAAGSRFALLVETDAGNVPAGELEVRADGTARLDLPSPSPPLPFIPAIWVRAER